VVSYALPALIAIGQVRHHYCPSANPLRRFLRNSTRKSTLKVLARIQPPNGGFLEAIPLTSFVTMSLAASGQAEHLVTRRAVDFIRSTVRPDGSWPIDTNLGTWVSTLSINALSERVADPESPGGPLTPEDRHQIQRWLLNEQHTEPHAYTDAPPGGWAWTDQPGGVPDADDTAGALMAIRNLEWAPEQRFSEGIAEGLSWLANLQNKDGGIPTFCRGWGKLQFDRSSPDLTAHAIRAWLGWLSGCEPPLRQRIELALQRAVRFLLKTQLADGSWIPLWFGNQHAPDEVNATYGTSRVAHALVDVLAGEWKSARQKKVARALSRAAEWLMKAQNSNGGWSGFADGPPSTEETALAVHALAKILSLPANSLEITPGELDTALRRGVSWLIARVQDESWTEPSPIGFYFAKLWYWEKIYPLAFTVAALRAVDALLVRRLKR
jgi:squalene-hopene/tetraprenyl-beta-curcumene cyclase